MSPARKIVQLLTRDQRRSATVLLGLMLVGMVLETLSVGLIVPALGLLTDQDLVASYPALESLSAAFGHPGQKELIMGAMVALVGVYGLKALFLAFLAWKQSRFVFDVQATLSQRLFTGYLRQPWTFHLLRNSAQLIRNATGEVAQFTGNALRPGILLIAESLVLIGIVTLLLIVEPVGALIVVGALGLAAWVFQRVTRGFILRWGEARKYHDGLRLKHLQQGLGGAKDVKLLGREDEFFAQYSKHNLGSARTARRQNTIQQLPRIWLELLAVTGLAGIVLLMIAQGKPLVSLLPTLGVFAAAAFRLIPSANRLLSAVQSLRYALPVVHTLHREIQTIDNSILPKRHSPLPFTQKLELENIRFKYPNSETYALNNVTMTILHGASVGFVGTSGSGKSTLVDVVLGLLTPAGGRPD